MPFIRGRYHINAVAGEALEAAREAEAALLALQHDAESADDSANGGNATNAKGPIHRVEIEAAETVPAHSGRAQRGFVARIHRAAVSRNDAPDQSPSDEFSAPASPGKDNLARVASGSTSQPETHVFADHGDLVNFLRNEFSNDRDAS